MTTQRQTILAFFSALYQKSKNRTASLFAVLLAVAAVIISEKITLYGADQSDSQPKSNSEYYRSVGWQETRLMFPVTIVCDGDEEVVMTSGGTVDQILEQADIELGKQDKVSLSLRQQVREGDVIAVTRRAKVTEEREVTLPYKTMSIPTSLLAEGKEKVLVQGKTGLAVETYRQTIVDGKQAEMEVIRETVVTEPVTEQILVGKPYHAISQLDFGYSFDENGEPIGYTSVLRAQRAAGYSARVGAKTASGMDAVVGHVAVDPNVIPYGSKLYIKSTDGSFVYGYAVSADTGTAIRDGLIAVDLFYGSYQESALNGIKSVDIFILE